MPDDVTPDAPRGDLGSVEVWRYPGIFTPGEHVFLDAEHGGGNGDRDEPGRWRELDADDALLAVVEAARVLDGIQPGKTRMRDWLIASVNLTRALALLDGGRREGA